MTGEELAQEINEVQQSLEELAHTEKPLSAEDEKRRQTLTIRKLVLERIAGARQKQHTREEIYHNAYYSLLKPGWASRHPFLANLLLRKFRWSIDTGV